MRVREATERCGWERVLLQVSSNGKGKGREREVGERRGGGYIGVRRLVVTRRMWQLAGPLGAVKPRHSATDTLAGIIRQ